MLHDAESVFHSVCNRYSVENAYLDEKEDTCCAMGELATNCKGSFMPFLNECFKEVRLIKRSKILQMINHSPLTFGAVRKVRYNDFDPRLTSLIDCFHPRFGRWWIIHRRASRKPRSQLSDNFAVH